MSDEAALSIGRAATGAGACAGFGVWLWGRGAVLLHSSRIASQADCTLPGAGTCAIGVGISSSTMHLLSLWHVGKSHLLSPFAFPAPKRGVSPARRPPCRPSEHRRLPQIRPHVRLAASVSSCRVGGRTVAVLVSSPRSFLPLSPPDCRPSRADSHTCLAEVPPPPRCGCSSGHRCQEGQTGVLPSGQRSHRLAAGNKSPLCLPSRPGLREDTELGTLSATLLSLPQSPAHSTMEARLFSRAWLQAGACPS